MDIQDQEQVWDAIAADWRIYRTEPIKEAAEFIENKKGKILDVGCGSGRNFTRTKGTIYGVDFSKKMLVYARKKIKNFSIKAVLKNAHAHNLPFKDNFFDSALCTSVLHCIQKPEYMEKSIQELFRVLKPKARALITVWNKKQPKFEKSKKEVTVGWNVRGKKHMRYYYLYERPELVSLIKKAGFKIIKVKDKDTPHGFYSKRNILVYVQKP